MRLCAIVICMTTLVVSIHGIDTEAHDSCQKDSKTHISEESLRKLKRREQVDKSLIGPHLLCVNIKFGYQNEDGSINKPFMKKILSQFIFDEDELTITVDKCAVDKDDAQDTAIALTNCFWENDFLNNLNLQPICVRNYHK